MAHGNRLKAFAYRLAQADMAFYVLPPIMLYLVLGTLAQREIGLYAAHKMFFSGFILWAGPVPLPGFYVFAAILTFSVLLKFLLNSEWTLKKSGINLTHLGVLVLLGGGLVTALTAREGYMMIAEGDASPYVYDYTRRELFIFENDNLLRTVSFENLNAAVTGLPFNLNPIKQCTNCDIQQRESEEKKFKGMAQFMALSPKPSEKEPEQNISGVTLEITGTQKGDGTYIAFEGMPKPIELTARGRTYKIMFGRQQRLLPFGIKLLDFTKENYPGLDKARAYSSDIVILDGDLSWPARIEMNAPLRYKGYTFYQSSFDEGPQGEATVLSVVENKGRIFPYIGTALVAAGLLLHLFFMRKSP